MLNDKFLDRMKSLLGDEYEAFKNALENESAVKAIRINSIKTSIDDFKDLSDIETESLAYANDGFILKNPDGIGNTPEHHSGMIYVQDPGAMATANALEIKEGWKVLDSCAAPGGKSGQAAAKIGDTGFILSNEYVPKRAKIVVSNFERLGVKNAIVTSLDTAELKKMYRDFFDLVIADVPCSGEGMFRKSDEALSEWSIENVLACAERQREIINNVAPLVKPGGYLLYSTCTYSLEENEMVIDEFLSERDEFELVSVADELIKQTRDGIVFDGAKNENLKLARRFYPHVSKGEGQFIALMKRRDGEAKKQTILYTNSAKQPSKDELCAINKFFKEALIKSPDGKLIKVGENLIISEHGVDIPPKSVFSAGVLIGEVRSGMLFPSHQFFSAYGKIFKRRESLNKSDARLTAYLRGEEIESKQIEGNGWCVVEFERAVIGGGKASSGKIKNHYPKGLRIK